MFRIAFTTKKRRLWTITCQRETEIFLNHKCHLPFRCSLWWATVQEPQLRTMHQQPPSVWSLLLGLTDGISQGECERWTELGRGHEFLRGIVGYLCCFVFEMFPFLWGKGKSVFLFELGTGSEWWFQGIASAERPMVDMKGRDGGEEEKLSELSVKNIKVEVRLCLANHRGNHLHIYMHILHRIMTLQYSSFVAEFAFMLKSYRVTFAFCCHTTHWPTPVILYKPSWISLKAAAQTDDNTDLSDELLWEGKAKYL